MKKYVYLVYDDTDDLYSFSGHTVRLVSVYDGFASDETKPSNVVDASSKQSDYTHKSIFVGTVQKEVKK